MPELDSARSIRQTADMFGFKFKKGLGQNFLAAPDITEKIAEAAGDGGVIEIGPGFGTLTQALCKRAKKVTALEIDEKLLPVLKYTLSGFNNVSVINADVMKTNLKALIKTEFDEMSVSVAANLPYYITTPVIAKLLEDNLPLENIVIMVQREVAQRILAKPSTKDYGAMTLMCLYYTEPEIIAQVEAERFVPRPQVDSTVLCLHVLKTPRVAVKDEKTFFRVVKAAFSQRRKTLLNCLCAAFRSEKAETGAILEELGIDPRRRGETLSIDEFALLADAIGEKLVLP